MRRSLRMLFALTFLTAGLAPVLIALTPGTAGATACGTAIPAGSTCTLTGTLDLTGGSLTLTTPATLSWGTSLTGLDQSVYDTVGGDEQYTVNDATGTGAGWHVTMSATTFTNGSHTLPNSGTLAAGVTSSITATSAPTDTCVSGSTCTLPSNEVTTYPVAITTATSSPTPSVIYGTVTSSYTGLGEILIGGSSQANPAGWWLTIPADAYSGSYTSTVTMEVISGP